MERWRALRLRLIGSIGARLATGQGEAFVDFAPDAVSHEAVVTLALDTTTRDGSLALVRDGRLICKRVGDAGKTWTERLPADLIGLLDGEGLRVADIDLYGVAAGPGSFTGLRIGIASIQGLALVHAKPVVAVSALDALAEVASGLRGALNRNAATGAARAETLIAVWMDGRRGQVFSALYLSPSAGKVEPVEAPRAEAPDQSLTRWTERQASRRPWVFIGDGCHMYRDVIDAAGWDAAIVDPTPPLASQIAAMAEREAAAGRAGAPGAIRPLYVRRSDAELARDRRLEDANRGC